ncbi:probable LRR receptor-like serine/threonine-protein kinase at1g56140 [Phtheirospermum japonicum]|uniref:Probable LRR receptor-like serine/threonine-protein kinase at1g56140 n=1 Tax=Phtheirospermum japonicum TaxID=374723 RepID=A0A830C6F0_9LAMI|nr:probable LRR receptor-like serine/threonine-protein kinase at1g56140 [Phtheirospermum japonicum]
MTSDTFSLRSRAHSTITITPRIKTTSPSPLHQIFSNRFLHLRFFSYAALVPRVISTFINPNKTKKGILKNGTEVAVKTLSVGSKQGAHEFLTEIDTISNVKHPNLVELLGCCVHGANQILVYEYLENSSIDRALLGSKRSINLDWKKRSAICIGTARGLAYLHEETHAPHFQTNVLVRAQPGISHLAGPVLLQKSPAIKPVERTIGYLAPEYVLGGQLTMKADVYSFGVLTLEVVSGRSSGNADYGGGQKLLVEWAWELYEEGKLLDLVDPELEGFPNDEITRYMKVALFCTQANASRRPLMSQVLAMLSKNVTLNEKLLTPPGFFEGSGQLSGKMKSSETSTSHQMSSFPVTITQVTPR